MEISKLYKEIIPPNNYENRRDFKNKKIIDSLSKSEKTEIEKLLIAGLKSNNRDLLIIKTLTYMNSKDSIPLMKQHLETPENSSAEVVIAACIYKLDNSEHEMIDVAYNAFLNTNSKYDKIPLFYYLVLFKSEKIDNLIKSYFNDNDVSIAGNAKRAVEGYYDDIL
ncbi:hypothetical protein GWA97_10105 [Flavobacterium sp. LaA7.5]|nr:hypothetical protein [Flavobacterium salilacus subsp. altitudinum]